MTTQSSGEDAREFLERVIGPSAFRVEEDLGDGFVRLKSSEAERRQAAQDIRSVEDAVIELLRNSRDANAQNIFVATTLQSGIRKLVVIDDGTGIPESMHKRVFQPRVTSKLDTSHMDKWGMHGRGMALYSVKENVDEVAIMRSGTGIGTAISLSVSTDRLPEKKDQSTFPHFEKVGSSYSMRGPKNIVRSVCEFAFEHRGELEVFFGTPVEIASTLYSFGRSTLTLHETVFASSEIPISKALSLAADPEMLVDVASQMGLEMSSRSARRIMDGEVVPLPSIMERIERESFASVATKKRKPASNQATRSLSKAKFSKVDLQEASGEFSQGFKALAEKYYLDPDVEPILKKANGMLTVSFPLVDK